MDGESITDYIIRAESAATALRNAEETISDALLIAMVLKGLPGTFHTFSAIVIQQEKEMSFLEFKTALRSFEENEKSRNRRSEDNIMALRSGEKFDGNCFKCGKKGHKKTDCRSKTGKWCSQCKSRSHDIKESRAKLGKIDSAKKAEEDENEHSFTFKVSDSSNSEHVGKSLYSDNLLVDTGATSHIITDKSKFIAFDKDFNTYSHVIELADESKANVVAGKGVAKVKLNDVNGKPHDVMLKNALHVPSYKQDLFSVNAALEEGGSVKLDKHSKQFCSASGATFNIEQIGRLYYMNSISSTNGAYTLAEWHRILGHCNISDIRQLEEVTVGMKISNYDEEECKVCTQGKMRQHRNREPDRRATEPLALVHSDLAGPIAPVAREGFKYALSFVGDYSGVIMIYFLKQKSDTVEATKQFLADVTRIGNVKCIRTDNGGEYVGKEFRSLLRENKIKHETCSPYSPHQNGTAERAWLSIFNMARCLLLDSNLPNVLWTYAVMASAYIRNRCFNDRLGKTPYETMTGFQPNLSNMHVFGSLCYAFVQNPKKFRPEFSIQGEMRKIL